MRGGQAWRLRLLGAAELLAPDGTTIVFAQRKSFALLAYVERQPERRASRDRIAALLWDHADGAQARVNLRKALYAIRTATDRVQPLDIHSQNDAIAIDPNQLASDASAFEAALPDEGGSLAELHAAAELYRGDFMADFVVRNAPDFEYWMLVERQRLRECAIRVFCRIMEHEAELPEARASAALRVLSLDPLQEAAHRALMRQLARQDRHAAALKHYHGLTDTLSRELGALPDPATQELFRQISQSRQARTAVPGNAPGPAGAAAAPVEGEPAGPPSVGRREPARPPRRWRAAAIAACAFSLPLIAIAYWSWSELPAADGSATAEAVRSVAVLPFATFDDQRKDSAFADGLTEEIINSLVQSSDLQVTGRTSSFHFKDKNVDLRDIGRRLGVSHIVEGSVRRSGNRVRVTAQLINVENGFHLWSNAYDRTLDDFFGIQADIAESVARELHARLAPPEEELHRFTPENYRTYLLALSHMRSERQEDLETARDLFERLRKSQPENAHAHAGYVMATIKLERAWYSVGYQTALSESERAVAQALESAPNLGETHLAQGLLYHFLAVNYGEARHSQRAGAALQRAVQLAPRNANALAAYGEHLSFLGRNNEAIPLLRRAIELDPLAIAPRLKLAEAYEGAGRADEAWTQYRSVREDHPNLVSVKFRMGRLKVRQGKLDQAEPWLREAFAQDESLATGVWLANVYLNLGMKERAFATLEQASVASDLTRLLIPAVKHAHEGEFARLLRYAEGRFAEDGDSLWLSAALLAAVMVEDNHKARRVLVRIAPDLLKDKPVIDPQGHGHAALGAHALAALGDTVQANRILQQLIVDGQRPGSSRAIEDTAWRVSALAQLGRREQALQELRRAIDAGYRTPIDRDNFTHIGRYPMLRSLRDDPAFRAMLMEIDRDLRRMRAAIERNPNAVAR